MAKGKKSRVSGFNRELPDPTETSKTVSSITNQPEPVQRGKGRPKATHNKKRFTTLLEKESIETVKIISSVTGLEQNEIYSEAVKDYIDKFKTQYPDKYKLVEATLKVKKHT